MATEPTLGRRILDAAEEYADAVQAAYDEWGAREWTPRHERATAGGFNKLRALCARADAAERGMVAFAEEVAGDNWHRLVAERTEALAAWRVLGEVDG